MAAVEVVYHSDSGRVTDRHEELRLILDLIKILTQCTTMNTAVHKGMRGEESRLRFSRFKGGTRRQVTLVRLY